MRNLNTHPSYEELRSLRAQARAESGPIRGNVLADGLRSYSTRGEEYVADVQRMIRGNATEELDGEEIVSCEIAPLRGVFAPSQAVGGLGGKARIYYRSTLSSL